MKTRHISYILLPVITLLHLLVFIKYPFDPNPNPITILGELLKTVVPYGLLITLVPKVSKLLGRILLPGIVNVVGLTIFLVSVCYQIIDKPGQAWSTVAFSSILILAMYNYLLHNRRLDSTTALATSFMTTWLGWVVFEIVFQIGMWFYHPEAFTVDIVVLTQVMSTMAWWLLPAVTYLAFQRWSRKLTLNTGHYFKLLVAVAVVATFVWFYTGMLIPIPINDDGQAYRLGIEYFTPEHFEFSISRLTQISIMGASITLLLNKRCKSV